MKNQRIAVIGGGNLGGSIAEGLLKSGAYQAADITVTRRKVERIAHLSEQGVQVHSDNLLAVAHSDIIILAVKPYNIDKILNEIKPKVHDGHLIISVATGITIANMEAMLGVPVPIFRAMPNTAIAIRESMTCIATKNGDASQVQTVQHIFDQLGKSLIINEDLMDAATVLAACGIAYALRFMRAQSQGGIEIGFDAQTAQTIAAQTVKGAAGLLIEGGQHPEREIDKVTTPQGCTIAGLNEMEHQGFSSSLIKGIITSYNKI
jgi:pyrroline-5-carboxylate reductase